MLEKATGGVRKACFSKAQGLSPLVFIVVGCLVVLTLACPCRLLAAEASSPGEADPALRAIREMLTNAGEVQNRRDKLTLYGELVQAHKDSADPQARELVAQAIGEMATLLRRDVDGQGGMDRLITLLKGSAAENNIPRLINGQADMANVDSVKRELYDRVIGEYGDNPDPLVQGAVLEALVRRAGITQEKNAMAALLERAVGMAGTVDTGAFVRYVISAVLARTAMLDDDAEIIAHFDAVLEQGLRRAADFDGKLLDGLKQLLAIKAVLVDDPGVANRYYDDLIALNPGPVPVANALLAKTREGVGKEERVALFDRIIADYADSPDNRLREIVNSARFGKTWYAVENAERIGILDEVIAGGWDAAGSRLRLDAARALLARASLVNDRREMLRAYDRIIECSLSRDIGSGFELQEAMTRRARLAGESLSPEQYYDTLFSRAADDEGRLSALTGKLYALTGRDAVIAVCDEIIDRFQGSDDISFRESVAEARRRKAELLDDRDEKIRLYDAIIADGMGVYGEDESVVVTAYKEKIALFNDNAEKLRLYDKLLARYENYPEFLLPLSETPVPSGGEPGNWWWIYSDGFRFGNLKDWRVNSVRGTIVDSLNAKAEMATGREEKIALYDQAIDGYGGTMRILLEDHVRRVVKAKAKLLGDKSVVERFEDRRIRMYPDSAETLTVLADRARDIADTVDRAEAFDRLIDRFASSRDRMVLSGVIELLLERAEITDDIAEKLTAYDRAVIIGVGLDRIFTLGPRAEPLWGRLRLTEGVEEKIHVYDKQISLLKKTRSMNGSYRLSEVLLEKAELVAEREEKIRLYDEVIVMGRDETQFYNPERFVEKALQLKAEACGDKGLEARYYDRVMEEGGSSGRILWAARARLRLAADTQDKIEVYDRVIDRIKCFSPDGREIFEFLMAKAKLVKDGTEKARILDEAALFCPDDASVIALVKTRAKLVSTIPEKIELYRAAFERVRGNRDFLRSNRRNSVDNDFTPVIELFEDWIAVVDDNAGKAELYRLVLSECKDRFDHRTSQKACELAVEFAALTGDREEMLEYFDQRIGLAENDGDASCAYLEKTALVESPGEVGKVLDALLVRYRFSKNDDAWNNVRRALGRKLVLAGDLPAMAAIYGELAEHLKTRSPEYNQRDIAKALLNQANLVTDKKTAEALYEDIIARYESKKWPNLWATYMESMGRKAELADSVVEKLRLYDTMLDSQVSNRFSVSLSLLYFPDEAPGKILPPYMMKKAALLTDKAEREKIYDRIIELYGQKNPPAAIEAYFAKMELADEMAGKLALCDELLGFIRGGPGRAGELPRALRRKAEVYGDKSLLKGYYDAETAMAESAVDKDLLTLCRLRDIGGADETLMACNGLIDKYGNSRKREELALIFLAYTTRAEIEERSDVAAAVRTYDECLKFFLSRTKACGMAAQPFLFEILADVYDGKARLTSTWGGKLRLYDDAFTVFNQCAGAHGIPTKKLLDSKVRMLREREDG